MYGIKPHHILYILFFRQQLMKDWKTDTLITTEDCIKFGRSTHVQNVIKNFEVIEDETKLGEGVHFILKTLIYLMSVQTLH